MYLSNLAIVGIIQNIILVQCFFFQFHEIRFAVLIIKKATNRIIIQKRNTKVNLRIIFTYYVAKFGLQRVIRFKVYEIVSSGTNFVVFTVMVYSKDQYKIHCYSFKF